MNFEAAADGELFAGLRSGDEAAAAEFCHRYGPMIERLAERRLTAPLKRRIGADDVAQSVCRTFVRRAGEGEFEIAAGDGLWSLLCAIALTKIREQTRFHLRQKRSMREERHLDSVTPDGERKVPETPISEPPPDAIAETADMFDRLIAAFDEEERRLIELKLHGHTLEEIAEQMPCSERTVRRFLKRVQDRLTQLLEKSATFDGDSGARAGTAR
jgi:RNA polymerase sigma factor (sigma-70 family)